MGLIDALTALRAKLTATTGAMHAEIAALRGQIRSVHAKLQHARQSPLPRDEIVTRADALVTEIGAEWLNRHGRELLVTSATGWRALGAADDRARLRLPDGIRDDLFGFVALVDPDRARAWLGVLVDAVPFEPGPASSERPALIARLERELADLESFEEGAIDEAAAAGVVIAHRPEVLRRRQNEARQRELAELAVAQRRRRQEAIDAEGQPRVGVSEYLGEERVGRPVKL